MTEDFIKAISLASKKVAEELTVDLQDRAVEIGWPRAIADNIFVDFNLDTTTFFVSYHPEFESQVFDLEYGDGEMSPLPIMRVYENSVNREAAPRLDVLLQEELIRVGVL